MWEIHTFGNGDVIASILNGIRLLMMTGPYTGLLLFAVLLLSALAVGNFMIDRRQYFPLFFGAVVVFYVTTQIPVDVLVVDEVNSDVPDQVVAGVPLAVALPAYVSGYAGWRFTQLVETAFAIPADYSTGRSTLNRPMFDLQKILGHEIRDLDLEERIQTYLMDCVFADFELLPPRAGSPTIAVLRTSADLLTDISTDNTGRAVGLTGIPCATYYVNELLPRFAIGSPGYDKTNRYLQTQLQVVPLSFLDEDGIATALVGNLIPVAQTGRQMINNSLIIKSWRQAMSHEKSKFRDATGSLAEFQKTLTLNLKHQAYSTSNLVQKMVPMLRTIIEGIVYLSTPLVLVLAMSPAMGSILGLYVKMFLWLQTWGPLYAILNLVMYQESRARLTSITAAGGFSSVNLSSYDSYLEFVSMMNSVAGDYIWMVPAVGWALVWGGSSIGGALSGAGRSAQSTSSQIAGEFASGRGQTMLEATGFRWESQMQLADGQVVSGSLGPVSGSHMVFAPVSGSGGISMVDQVGNMTMRGQDGSVTSLAANGAMTVQTPHGTYSKDKDGNLVAGVFRGKIYDPESGRTMEMQEEVRGDEIFRHGVYRDASGREHKVEQVNNQASGHQVSRIDSFKTAGFEGVEETFSDGTKLFQTKRTGPGTLHTPMSGEITGEMVQEDTYIKQPGVEGGYRHVAGSAHQVSKDGGERKYAIARPGGSGEKDDILNRPGTGFVVSGTDSNVVDKQRMNSSSLLERSAEGYGAIVGGAKGVTGLSVIDSGGYEFFLEGAQFSTSDGSSLDKNGMPQEGSIVTADKETGSDRIHATGKMVKDSNSGQLAMQASNVSFTRKLGGDSSGHSKVVPLSNGNFLVFKGGDLSYKGNPSDPKTPYDYKGIVLDPQTGIETSRTMHFDGQNLVSSSGSGGQTQQLVQSDGSTMTIDGDMNSPGGAKYTRSWPVQKGLFHIGNDSRGNSIVEERAFSRKETGSIKSSANEGIQLSDQNNQISEDSARGQSKLSGSFVNADKGSLVGKDGHSLLPPVVDSEGKVHLEGQRVPVFVPSSGKESSRVEQQGLGVGMHGELVEQNRTIDPSSGSVVREKLEGGRSSNFYLDETKIHAADEAQSSYGHWILEAARASKQIDSQAMAERYGAWAGSLGDIVRLEGFDPNNPEHKGRLLMGLEMLDKAENVADKSLMYASRFGSIMRAAQLGKKLKQAESVK